MTHSRIITNVKNHIVDPLVNVLEHGPGSGSGPGPGSGSGPGPSVAAAARRAAAPSHGPGPDPDLGPGPDPDPGTCSGTSILGSEVLVAGRSSSVSGERLASGGQKKKTLKEQHWTLKSTY